MKLYVASSWRNLEYPTIVNLLRIIGHEVYDFRNPHLGPGERGKGFQWSEIDPEWQDWTPEQFRKALAHPKAADGFAADHAGMQWADACVLVMPCGRSAHLEAGWFIGAGKPCAILLSDGEPELTYGLAAKLCTNRLELIQWLDALPAKTRDCTDQYRDAEAAEPVVYEGNLRNQGPFVRLEDHRAALAAERAKREKAEREVDRLERAKRFLAGCRDDRERKLAEANATIERKSLELSSLQKDHQERGEMYDKILAEVERLRGELEVCRSSMSEDASIRTDVVLAAHRENLSLTRQLDRAREVLEEMNAEFGGAHRLGMLITQALEFITPEPAEEQPAVEEPAGEEPTHEQIMDASEEELDAMIRSQGRDPKDVLAIGKQAIALGLATAQCRSDQALLRERNSRPQPATSAASPRWAWGGEVVEET